MSCKNLWIQRWLQMQMLRCYTQTGALLYQDNQIIYSCVQLSHVLYCKQVHWMPCWPEQRLIRGGKHFISHRWSDSLVCSPVVWRMDAKSVHACLIICIQGEGVIVEHVWHCTCHIKAVTLSLNRLAHTCIAIHLAIVTYACDNVQHTCFAANSNFSPLR